MNMKIAEGKIRRIDERLTLAVQKAYDEAIKIYQKLDEDAQEEVFLDESPSMFIRRIVEDAISFADD